ncbi:Conserved DNA-binding protein YbaB [Saccharopolyspora antimicrobica]|uniref:DNA-binding protein YbaB n=1 Tax=Saccharopolyspora antimicrobica TaxID=455193 RepID=A0A1I4XG35_9PSEU|nr:YbaB/EbfC family nucleoid-associated protein [Saccharopolyspora antimicrobica]RKT84497.1 DNA-binding protein YbaB [Saccharopolyspora antimicrobica]SFN24854.1 Conserved DNA-binding protein YbaB [Saccharopolyspora antimicrobica]
MPGQNQGGFAAIGADPDEAERRIQEWAKGFEEKAQRYQAVQAETEQLRLTATSDGGHIKVTVRADGSVTDLEFTDKVRSLPPRELASQILSTMHRAQADIANRVGETMAAHLGDEDLQTRTMMLDNLRERFPEEPEDESAEPEVSSKWDAPADEEPTPSPPPPAPPVAGPNPPAAPKKRPNFEDDDDPDFDDPDFDPLRD